MHKNSKQESNNTVIGLMILHRPTLSSRFHTCVAKALPSTLLSWRLPVPVWCRALRTNRMHSAPRNSPRPALGTTNIRTIHAAAPPEATAQAVTIHPPTTAIRLPGNRIAATAMVKVPPLPWKSLVVPRSLLQLLPTTLSRCYIIPLPQL